MQPLPTSQGHTLVPRAAGGLAQGVPSSQNPVAVYLSRLAPGSRRTMAQALDTIAGYLSRGRLTAEAIPWSRLRYQHTAAIRSTLATRYAPSTANKMLAALRGVLKEAWRLGLLPAEAYHQAVDLPAIRGENLLRGRTLTTAELKALFGACSADPTPAGRRDAALLATLYGAGLRRSEAAALQVADFDTDSGELTVRAGKGRKSRTTYLPKSGRLIVSEWLLNRGREPGAIFVPLSKLGKTAPRAMTAQAIYLALRKRAKQARVRSFSPHDLRRTFVSDLLDAGADIATVQKLAGHSQVSTTQRYDRRGEDAKKRASELLHVPFVA